MRAAAGCAALSSKSRDRETRFEIDVQPPHSGPPKAHNQAARIERLARCRHPPSRSSRCRTLRWLRTFPAAWPGSNLAEWEPGRGRLLAAEATPPSVQDQANEGQTPCASRNSSRKWPAPPHRSGGWLEEKREASTNPVEAGYGRPQTRSPHRGFYALRGCGPGPRRGFSIVSTGRWPPLAALENRNSRRWSHRLLPRS